MKKQKTPLVEHTIIQVDPAEYDGFSWVTIAAGGVLNRQSEVGWHRSLEEAVAELVSTLNRWSRMR